MERMLLVSTRQKDRLNPTDIENKMRLHLLTRKGTREGKEREIYSRCSCPITHLAHGRRQGGSRAGDREGVEQGDG